MKNKAVERIMAQATQTARQAVVDAVFTPKDAMDKDIAYWMGGMRGGGKAHAIAIAYHQDKGVEMEDLNKLKKVELIELVEDLREETEALHERINRLAGTRPSIINSSTTTTIPPGYRLVEIPGKNKS